MLWHAHSKKMFSFYFKLQKCYLVFTLFHDFKGLYSKMWNFFFLFFFTFCFTDLWNEKTKLKLGGVLWLKLNRKCSLKTNMILVWHLLFKLRACLVGLFVLSSDISSLWHVHKTFSTYLHKLSMIAFENIL
jgi:hypothetical protein